MQRANVTVLLVAVATTFVGCVTTPEFRPEAIKAYEYRQFPEYGGYFPIQAITNLGRTGIVRADWVVPVKGPDGKPDYTPPASRDEAERRVCRTGKRERQLIEPLAVPLQPVALGLGVATVLGLAPFTLAGRHEAEKNVGVEITIQVTDSDGRPLPGARVREFPSLLVYPIYADAVGRRTFAPPRLQAYEVSSDSIALLAEHLPIHLGRDTSWAVTDRADLTDGFTQRADANGRITYTSIALARVRGGQEGGEEQAWITPPPSLRLNLFVWAAGFTSAVLTTPAVRAKDKLSFTVALKPLPDCAHIAQAAGALGNVPQRIREAIHPTMWSSYPSKVEVPLLKPLVRDLEQWARDETLPGYLRWNAVDFLQRLTWEVPHKEKALQQEVKAALARAETGAATLSPYLSDAAPNPWRALSEAEMLFHKLSETGLGPGPAAQARTALAEGDATLPGLPLWDNLRAVVALAEGDREQAVTLSPGLDHHHFFRLFYGLEVQPQPVRGGLGE